MKNKKLNQKHPVKVICFYTANTPYEQEVENLRISCENHQIDIYIEPKKSQGSWEKNVALKPFFILDTLHLFKTPVLWVDADSVFLKKPDFTLFTPYDFSARSNLLFPNDKRFSICGGTLFVNYTKAAIDLVERWCKKCKEQMKKEIISFIDQVTLYDTLIEEKDAKIFSMPVSYCKIYDLDSFFIDDECVIIEHRQASRNLKDIIK